MENGVEVSRTLVSSRITVQPVTEIIDRGTRAHDSGD
ncbi:MAG: G5 domain-containing protein [Clostridia bacterium]|nr:G5 domain-containing protein [Clostridia bacterium]